MKFDKLVKIAADIPCFTTGFLTAGQKKEQVSLQLARWVKDGRVIRICKGLYILAEPYRKCKIDVYFISNQIQSPSYVSLQSALAYYGLIPEYVPTVLSVTTGRPRIIQTPLGRFEFRHLKQTLFFGYDQTETAPGCQAFIAKPEKALLDLLYLTPGSDSEAWLKELRLQDTERINPRTLNNLAQKSHSPKLKRAAALMIKRIERDEGTRL